MQWKESKYFKYLFISVLVATHHKMPLRHVRRFSWWFDVSCRTSGDYANVEDKESVTLLMSDEYVCDGC